MKCRALNERQGIYNNEGRTLMKCRTFKGFKAKHKALRNRFLRFWVKNWQKTAEVSADRQ